MCQTPFIFPVWRFSCWQEPRWDVGEVRCSSLYPYWCGSLWWLISASKCFKDTPFFSRILWKRGLMWDGKRDSISPVEESIGSAQSLADESWWILPGKYLSTSVSIKGQTGFLMKHSPHFSDWWLLQSFYIWYFSNAIHFSSLFIPFNNKAGTENQQFYCSFLKNISICKKLIKGQDSHWALLPLNQGMYFKHEHLFLRQATANTLTNTRWNVTYIAFMAPKIASSSPPPQGLYIPLLIPGTHRNLPTSFVCFFFFHFSSLF